MIVTGDVLRSLPAGFVSVLALALKRLRGIDNLAAELLTQVFGLLGAIVDPAGREGLIQIEKILADQQSLIRPDFDLVLLAARIIPCAGRGF